MPRHICVPRLATRFVATARSSSLKQTHGTHQNFLTLNMPQWGVQMSVIPVVLAFMLIFVACAKQELGTGAKRICNGLRSTWLRSNYDYDPLFSTYFDEMKRVLDTRQEGKIVRVDLQKEVKRPGRTFDSVWRIERQVLALCGFDFGRESRLREWYTRNMTGPEQWSWPWRRRMTTHLSFW